jgi:hypothetical protein
LKSNNRTDNETSMSMLQRRITLCFNFVLCRTNDSKVGIHDQSEEHRDYWAGFFQAYSTMDTPIFAGEIKQGTHDVTISYANRPALQLTGYNQGLFDDENPDGIIGRSVNDLMPDSDVVSHEEHIKTWLARYRWKQPIASSSDYLLKPPIENRVRPVKIKTPDGGVKIVNAKLSFFSPLDRGNKVLGIFSFTEADEEGFMSSDTSPDLSPDIQAGHSF